MPPTPPRIISPEDGAELTIGGAAGEDPQAPDTPFVVSWTEANDPEGDPVSYTWQLADVENFTTMLLSTDVGAATRFETTIGTIATVLDAAGIAPGESASLIHRVLAGDGQSSTAGATARVTLTRGVLLAAEDNASIPATHELAQNYPNPVRLTTEIAFSLPSPSSVQLVVFDVRGRTETDPCSARGCIAERLEPCMTSDERRTKARFPGWPHSLLVSTINVFIGMAHLACLDRTSYFPVEYWTLRTTWPTPSRTRRIERSTSLANS